MAEPAVADANDETETGPETEIVEDDDEEVEMVQTSVEETGADPEGFFDDVEPGGSDASAPDEMFDDVDGSEADDSESGSGSGASVALEDDINHGAARLSVIGLDDEWQTDDGTSTKQDLKEEFEETFEAFRLGHYGSVVIEEYLLEEADDIHPAWGLAGAMLICAAVVVYRRPDGDQLIDSGKTKLGEINFDLGSLRPDSDDDAETEETDD